MFRSRVVMGLGLPLQWVMSIEYIEYHFLSTLVKDSVSLVWTDCKVLLLIIVYQWLFCRKVWSGDWADENINCFLKLFCSLNSSSLSLVELINSISYLILKLIKHYFLLISNYLTLIFFNFWKKVNLFDASLVVWFIISVLVICFNVSNSRPRTYID